MSERGSFGEFEPPADIQPSTIDGTIADAKAVQQLFPKAQVSVSIKGSAFVVLTEVWPVTQSTFQSFSGSKEKKTPSKTSKPAKP